LSFIRIDIDLKGYFFLNCVTEIVYQRMSENVVGKRGGKSEEIEFFLFSIARLGKEEFYMLCYLKGRKRDDRVHTTIFKAGISIGIYTKK
jgi:hypothetical protein